ncbi:hypothetical protein GCM10010339_53840 [Streptomyces alanosinicus]|uniref:Uncharacterized protein n=1 Tax=Streptomyces alanosinicus TaxID=68171 RepID=A0A919D4H4_9ACTN|nr:hypothetical protein GCM10010339_53840 [Streptomyces alanosinicus]
MIVRNTPGSREDHAKQAGGSAPTAAGAPHGPGRRPPGHEPHTANRNSGPPHSRTASRTGPRTGFPPRLPAPEKRRGRVAPAERRAVRPVNLGRQYAGSQ